MSDPSPSESDSADPKGTLPETEVSELSAEELDEVSGAGLIYLTTGTSTGTVSTTPLPPPATSPR